MIIFHKAAFNRNSRLSIPSERMLMIWTTMSSTLRPFFCDFENCLAPAEVEKDWYQTIKYVNYMSLSGLPVFECYKILPTKVTYSDNDLITVFFENLKDHEAYVEDRLADKNPIFTLTPEQQLTHVTAHICFKCRTSMRWQKWKVVHHYHLTGNYTGPSCNDCNLQIKYEKGWRRKKVKSHKKNNRYNFNPYPKTRWNSQRDRSWRIG